MMVEVDTLLRTFLLCSPNRQALASTFLGCSKLARWRQSEPLLDMPWRVTASSLPVLQMWSEKR